MAESSLVNVKVIDRVIFSRWSAPPTKEDVGTMTRLMAETHAQKGAPLVYVAAVDSKAKVADSAQRALLNDLLTEGRKYVAAGFMVIEGSDLQHNLQRVIFSGMIIVTRTFGDFLRVAKSGEAIAADVGKLIGKDVKPFFKQAVEAGLLTK